MDVLRIIQLIERLTEYLEIDDIAVLLPALLKEVERMSPELQCIAEYREALRARRFRNRGMFCHSQ